MELKNAVNELGLLVSDEIFNLMALRYSDSSLKISFESFVYLMLRLEFMSRKFHEVSKDGKRIYLEESEWMLIILYS
nr:PREDICTED: calpain-13-like [Latimeria chalumnae]|eukprot:XP_014352840.1 PREDICTED: calpain-13-like [Latimeria chalumnae]